MHTGDEALGGGDVSKAVERHIAEMSKTGEPLGDVREVSLREDNPSVVGRARVKFTVGIAGADISTRYERKVLNTLS